MNISGDISHGQIYEEIKPQLAANPDWGSVLKIHIRFSVTPFSINKEMIVYGKLKLGKLHGLVKISGGFPNDPNDKLCQNLVLDGLTGFFGRFEDGKPAGVCWKELDGGAFIYGHVDKNGDFTGDDLAYIYPDLKTALKGSFKKGVMINARETEIIQGDTRNNPVITNPDKPNPRLWRILRLEKSFISLLLLPG